MRDELKWYNNPSFISIGIIIIILFIIICSQSFAVVGNSSISLFTSIINHNSIYLIALVYFCMLMTKFGKRYFNYMNVLLVFLYLMSSFTSLLTLVQSFSLNTIFSFFINFILLIYLFHTMFRDTRIWKEYKLGNSPFNELSNDFYFNTIIVLVILSLCVNLISTVVVSGLFISILDAIYIGFLTRYIYLYRKYLDDKKKDVSVIGNFSNIKENITDSITHIEEKSKEIYNDIVDSIDNQDGKKKKNSNKKQGGKKA